MSGHEEAVLQGGLLADLALEAWRLSKSISDGADVPVGATVAVRYSVRKMKRILEESGCGYVDLTGHSYDAGMALDVLSVEGGSGSDASELLVKEMVSPIILWKGRVLRHGEAVLQKITGAGALPEPPKEEKR